VAGMGLVGTASGGIAGIVLTQRKADRREQQTWDRERERERERWEREDGARTFEHRREAYVDFYTSVKVLVEKLSYESALDGDWQTEAYQKLQRVEFYADHDLCVAARKTYFAAYNWGVKVQHDEPEDTSAFAFERYYDDAEREMLRLMRNRL